MYKSLFYLFFVVSLLNIEAQGQVFRIDSIPEEGVLLNKGWKFHAGDNPDFAKPDFDDSKWESVDPTQDFHKMPNFKSGEIGWIRIKISFDSLITKQPVQLNFNQYIASEIFINGIKIKQYGSIISNKVVAYRPYYQFMGYIFHSNVSTISVRFAIEKSLPYINLPPINKCFQLRVFNSCVENNIAKQKADILIFIFFSAGCLLIVALIQLVYFFSFQKNLSNLFLSIATLSTTIAQSIYWLFYTNIYVSDVTYVCFLFVFLSFPVQYSFTFASFHSLTKNKRDYKFWIIFLLPYLSFVYTAQSYYLGGLAGMILPFILCMAVSLRISILKLKTNSNAVILVIGISIYIILFTLTLLYGLGILVNKNINNSFTIRDLFYFPSIVCIPVCLSIYLAKEYGLTSKHLQTRLTEVEKLSQEKQETLLKQNAELQAALLQGQTLERKRVAADLHDNLGSTMSSLIWTMEAIDANKLQPEEKNVYQSLKSMLSKAYDEVRMLSHNLLPEEFEKQGLTAALQYFIRKINQNSSIKFDLQIDETLGKLDKKVEFELYSICLELVNNIIKHSKATEAKIEISKTENQIKLTVEDNGIGIFENNSDGKGMKNVRARVESLNGVWNLQNIENQGVINEILIRV